MFKLIFLKIIVQRSYYVIPNYDQGVRAASQAGIYASSDIEALSTMSNSGWFIPEAGYRLNKMYVKVGAGSNSYYTLIIGRRFKDGDGNTVVEVLNQVELNFPTYSIKKYDIETSDKLSEGDELLIALRYGGGTKKYTGLNIQIILKK